MSLIERTALAAIGVLFAGASVAWIIVVAQRFLDERGRGK